MKKLITIGLVGTLLVLSCTKEKGLEKNTSKTPVDSSTMVCRVIGRWQSTMNVLYEFTDSFRYTMYLEDGKYGTLAEGKGLEKKKWWTIGDTLVVDLTGRGTSLQKSLQRFSCDCQVRHLETFYNNESFPSIYWREGYDTLRCK
jgi:hypothetical protein